MPSLTVFQPSADRVSVTAADAAVRIDISPAGVGIVCLMQRQAPRFVSWQQVAGFIETGELLDCLWGVVEDGSLTGIYDTETEASDCAEGQREYGVAASVVKISRAVLKSNP